MSRQIIISDLSGSTFYNIWGDEISKDIIPIYVNSIDDNDTESPYVITLPERFNYTQEFGLSLLKNNSVVFNDFLSDDRGQINPPNPIPDESFERVFNGNFVGGNGFRLYNSNGQTNDFSEPNTHIRYGYNNGEFLPPHSSECSGFGGRIVMSLKDDPSVYVTIDYVNSGVLASLYGVLGTDAYNDFSNGFTLVNYSSVSPFSTGDVVVFDRTCNSSVMYLSGLSSGYVYSINANGLRNITEGSYVSGNTYLSTTKEEDFFTSKALEKNNDLVPNFETVYKVISESDAENNKWYGGYYSSGYLKCPSFKIDGSEVEYNFKFIDINTTDILEPTTTTSTIKIRIDISNYTFNQAENETEIITNINYIISKFDEFIYLNNLNIDFDIDYYVYSGDTTFDNIKSPNIYRDYYLDNYGGIHNYSSHHYALLVNELEQGGGQVDAITGFYSMVTSDRFFRDDGWEVFIHEIGHLLGLTHTFECKWDSLYPELGYEFLDNAVGSKSPSCTVCGTVIPYLDEFNDTIYSAHTAIMSYSSFKCEDCSTFRGCENQLPTELRILNSYSFSSTFISGFYDVNVTYYNFLDKNEITINDLDYIVIQYQTSGSVVSDQKAKDISYLINTGNTMTYDVMTARTNTNTFTKTLSYSDISSIFDYSDQESFGITLERIIFNSSPSDSFTWSLGDGTLKISFYTHSGNNILNKQPKDFYSYNNGEKIKVHQRFTQRSNILSSYESQISSKLINYVNKNYYD